jgi:nucleoid-associated protein YgaU
VPKTKLKKASVRSSKPVAAKQEGFLSQIKWGESYTSLFLGAVVVLVALVLVFSFFKSRNFQNQQTGSTSTTNETTQLPKTYTVKEGDDLWSVSEKLYGSGYNWVDLASANKLKNPGVLYVGTKLNVPSVAPKTITSDTTKETQMPSITGVSYKVVEGDNLWSIAVRSYGDGFKWTEIAKVNNLKNPGIIHVGNVLKLPR